jgi:hypothetical protein
MIARSRTDSVASAPNVARRHLRRWIVSNTRVLVSYAIACSLTTRITNMIKETACRFKITPKPSRRELGSGSAAFLMPMAKAPRCGSNSLRRLVEGTGWRSRARRKSAIHSCRPYSDPGCRSSLVWGEDDPFSDDRLCRTLRAGDPGNEAGSDQVGRPHSDGE